MTHASFASTAGNAIATPAVIPEVMKASVYRGNSQLQLERVAVPEIGPGDLLVRVEACGICHTDLKKIEYDLLAPPRIYGHEMSGVVVSVGQNVTNFVPGERVCLFHHVPCLDCFYCEKKDYAQCQTYKRVGVTAGFEPAGGGFAQYVRVMDWIVRHGVIRIPEGICFDRASFVEPLNTCLKALAKCQVAPGEVVLVMGQGPIGLIFTWLLTQAGVESVYTTDLVSARLEASQHLGAKEAWSASETNFIAEIRNLTRGRGADLTVVAASAPGIVEQAVAASRPGGRVMLFAQTSNKESFKLSGKELCTEERSVFGSYSASVDLLRESAEMVWRSDFPAEELISHRIGLDEIPCGIEMTRYPASGSLKLIVHPQRH